MISYYMLSPFCFQFLVLMLGSDLSYVTSIMEFQLLEILLSYTLLLCKYKEKLVKVSHT